MKMNKQWHLKHPMPKNPTMDERIAWHVAHLENCACRELTPKLKAEFRKRKLPVKKGIKNYPSLLEFLIGA